MKRAILVIGIIVSLVAMSVMSSCHSRSRVVSKQPIRKEFQTIFISKDKIVGVYDSPDKITTAIIVVLHEDTVVLDDPSRIKLLNDENYNFCGLLYYKKRGE